MKIVYQSRQYKPEHVSGRYVRLLADDQFRVFDTATCVDRGPFYMQAGMGRTLREYDTDGSELPAELIERCKASGMTERWD